MIAVEGRPRLTPTARLRYDRHSGEHVLVHPERGLVLNNQAAELVALCDGTHTVAAIAERLAVRLSQRPAADVLRQVRLFLNDLATRGLVLVEA
jgi:pyrroloquinoline quinone biosynthesis protein D